MYLSHTSHINQIELHKRNCFLLFHEIIIFHELISNSHRVANYRAARNPTVALLINLMRPEKYLRLIAEEK